jgi:hypothetical protein
MPPLPPPVKLSILRDIGWTEWDPIGLREGDWRDMAGADEYDGYLLHAATRLQHGEPDSELIDYLVNIETEHMGLDASPTARSRAAAAVAAIKAYVQTLV